MNLRIRNYMPRTLYQWNPYATGISKMWKHGLILIQISHKTRLKPKTFTRLSIGWHKVIYGVALAAGEGGKIRKYLLA